MIRPCTPADFDRVLAIINAAAEAYRGIIPPDRLSNSIRLFGQEVAGRLKA